MEREKRLGVMPAWSDCDPSHQPAGRLQSRKINLQEICGQARSWDGRRATCREELKNEGASSTSHGTCEALKTESQIPCMKFLLWSISHVFFSSKNQHTCTHTFTHTYTQRKKLLHLPFIQTRVIWKSLQVNPLLPWYKVPVIYTELISSWD